MDHIKKKGHISLKDNILDNENNGGDTENSGSPAVSNRAAEMNRELFRRENKALELNNELFSAANGMRDASSQNCDLSGYTATQENGGFQADELFRPSPARGAWKTVVACMLASVMGFFGAVVGIVALSASGFSNSNSMLGNLIIDASGLETHKVVADETELSYTGGFIEVSERLINSVVELKELEIDTTTESGYSEKGSASGVIISADGYIITNEHVTNGMDKIRVTTSDGTVYIADIVGEDAITDIAVIKVDLPEGVTLQPITFGVSAGVRYGQSVIVIGNPMDIGLSVSTGIISNPDREMQSSGEINQVIQTDAAVSPGSSGGGMFDIYGNLIGIICAKTSGDGIEGLGYAVPIDTAKAVANDLMKYGYVKGRAAIGVTVVSVFDAASYDYYRNGELSGFLFNSRYGVYIVSTMRSTEIKRGDRLIKLDGQRVTSSGMISNFLKGKQPGDKVVVTVERLTADPDDGNAIETVTVEIELFERDW